MFCLEEGDRGETDHICMEIDTGDAYPRTQAPRQMPFAFRGDQAIQVTVGKPGVLVRKLNGTHRFCVD